MMAYSYLLVTKRIIEINKMKKIFLISYLLLLGILSCSTEADEFMDEGTITGHDIRECACCGGYYIEIGTNTYRFYELPPNTNFNLDNPNFPIFVKLD
jgi:hypothetical protein